MTLKHPPSPKRILLFEDEWLSGFLSCHAWQQSGDFSVAWFQTYHDTIKAIAGSDPFDLAVFDILIEDDRGGVRGVPGQAGAETGINLAQTWAEKRGLPFLFYSKLDLGIIPGDISNINGYKGYIEKARNTVDDVINKLKTALKA